MLQAEGRHLPSWPEGDGARRVEDAGTKLTCCFVGRRGGCFGHMPKGLWAEEEGVQIEDPLVSLELEKDNG